MSEQRYAELYERLTAGKRKETSRDYPFNRGWNAAIDYAIRQMKAACDEPAEDETQERAAR